ncbi:hypothetical protein [Streptomyces sp. NPDC004721]
MRYAFIDAEKATETEPAPDPQPISAPATEATAPDDAPVPDREADEDPDQEEEAVAGEPEPTAVTTDAPAADPAADNLPEQPPAATEADPAVEIEDPPEPRSYTEVTALPADASYQLHMTGMDGQAPDRGELRRGETAVATVQQSAGGQWFARLAVPGLPADVTNLADGPQAAAERGAVLFSTLTGTPYGDPPTAASGNGPLARANVVRAELRDTAMWHRGALTYPAARVWPLDYLAQPPYVELTARLNSMADALSGNHNSRQMAAELEAVAQSATAWRDALPADENNFERQLMAFPLAHLLHDVQRLQLRLQATVDAAQADREAARQQAVAEATPAAPAPAPQTDQAPAAPPADLDGQLPPEPPTPAAAEPPAVPAEPSGQDLPEEAESAANLAQETRPAAAADDVQPSGPEPAVGSPEPPAPASTPEGTEMATPTRPTQPEGLEPAPDDDGAQLGDPQPETAPQETEVAPQPEEMPLWTGPQTPAEDTATAEHTAGELDVTAAFEGVREAWTETVPEEQGTAKELWEAVEADLRTLHQHLADAVATANAEPAPDAPPVPAVTAPDASPTAAAAPAPVPAPQAPPAPTPAALPAPAPTEGATGDPSGEQTDTPDPQQQAEAVNTALRGADTQAEALKDLPEWQRLQTVRGAWTHLWKVIKDRAGEHFDRLKNDNRVGEFFRKVSLKVCEKVAEWAQAGADKLRRPDERDTEATTELPSAEALLRLGDAAFTYSSPRRAPAATPRPPPPAGRPTSRPCARWGRP